jgi:hypothetical protein
MGEHKQESSFKDIMTKYYFEKNNNLFTGYCVPKIIYSMIISFWIILYVYGLIKGFTSKNKTSTIETNKEESNKDEKTKNKFTLSPNFFTILCIIIFVIFLLLWWFYNLLFQHRLCLVPSILGTHLRWQQTFFTIILNIIPVGLTIASLVLVSKYN